MMSVARQRGWVEGQWSFSYAIKMKWHHGPGVIDGLGHVLFGGMTGRLADVTCLE